MFKATNPGTNRTTLWTVELKAVSKPVDASHEAFQTSKPSEETRVDFMHDRGTPGLNPTERPCHLPAFAIAFELSSILIQCLLATTNVRSELFDFLFIRYFTLPAACTPLIPNHQSDKGGGVSVSHSLCRQPGWPASVLASLASTVRILCR